VAGPDEHGRERVDVGIGRDPAQVALRGQVPGEALSGVGQNRNPGGPRPCQPDLQIGPVRDEADERHGHRLEQPGVARRRLPVEISTFEAWDPADRRFDAVVSGTAWHWVDPVAGATRAAEVLRQDGRLAVFWQTPELPPRIGTAFADAYRRVAPDSPISLPATSGADAYAPLFRKAADGIRAVDGFGEPEEWRFDWEQRCTRDQLLDQLRTSGAVTRLPGGALAEILEHVGAAVDALGGRVAARYATVTVTATRR
jgi:SAM-dependent methyltransferase